MGKKKKTEALLRRAQEAQERIDYLRLVYRGLRDYLQVQLDEIMPLSTETPKPQMKKAEEMLSLQTQLAKAEEAFDEQFNPDAVAEFDYDELRDQIGRTLDRIREAEHPIPVFDRVEQSSD